MAGIITAQIRVDKLPKEKFFKGKEDKDGNIPHYYNFTINLQDETRYGNNVSITDNQSKEEREAKVKKNYLGNGKVVWTNGEIKVADQEASIAETVNTNTSSDLPF